jgi:hypothetical protein
MAKTTKKDIGKKVRKVSFESQLKKLDFILTEFSKAGVSKGCLDSYIDMFKQTPHNYRPTMEIPQEELRYMQQRLQAGVNVLIDTYHKTPEQMEDFIAGFASAAYLSPCKVCNQHLKGTSKQKK